MPRGNIRKRPAADEEEEVSASNEEEQSSRERMQLLKGLQKGRQKSQGITIDPVSQQPTTARAKDDVEAIMGGYTKGRAQDKKDQADPDRERYIKEQLDKRLGRTQAEAVTNSLAAKSDDMYAIPAALRTQKVDQEDVSAWMTGIVEVPLSVVQRMKNVEETEQAKRQLLSSQGGSPEGQVQEKQKQMSRLSLPLRFGQHSAEDVQWQEAALRKQHQPREWKRKKKPEL